MPPLIRKIFRKKWAVEILDLLEKEGELNFGTIREKLNISPTTMTSTKNRLVEHGLVERVEVMRNDIRYKITRKGSQLLEKLKKAEEILRTN